MRRRDGIFQIGRRTTVVEVRIAIVQRLHRGGEPLILMPPEIANTFERGGCTKAQAKAAIYERAVLPLDRLSPAVRKHLTELRVAAKDGDVNSPLRVAHNADDIMIVVTGGVGVKAAYMPTWGGTTKAVSRVIRERR